MTRTLQVSAVGLLSIVVFLIVLLLNGKPASPEWIVYSGTATSVVGAVILLFDKVGWRWEFLQGWLVQHPHIYGRWEVTVTPDDGSNPVNATVEIRQTLTSVEMDMDAPKSKGRLLSGAVKPRGSGVYDYSGVYLNQPKQRARENLVIHHGCFQLDIEGPPNKPTALKGQYWTDRKTAGDLVFTRSASQ